MPYKSTQHYIKGTIGDKSGSFHIDSGAANSILTHPGVEFFGLDKKDTGKIRQFIAAVRTADEQLGGLSDDK